MIPATKVIGHFRSPRWGRVTVLQAEYTSGGVAIVLEDSGGAHLATLSVRLEGPPPLAPRFYAKTWSENGEIAREALDAGLFRDTGFRARTGFVIAQLWEIVGDPPALATPAGSAAVLAKLR